MQELRYTNGALLGYVYIEIDGDYVFIPSPGNGTWDSYTLNWVADQLNEMNKEWDKHIQKNI